MLICGIKLTHDGSVAVIDTDHDDMPKLLFSTEMEKLNNGARYAKIDDPSVIKQVLISEGFVLKDIDAWVLDGWKGGRANGLPVESYHEFDGGAEGDLMASLVGGELRIGEFIAPYRSYRHMASHIIGSYVVSPWGRTCEPVYAVTWDGGQNPRVYYVDPESTPSLIYVGTVMEFYGIIYSIMGYYFGPYKNAEVMARQIIGAADPLYGGYETPGKLMSYIALGNLDRGLYDRMLEIYVGMERELKAGMSSRMLLDYNQNGIFEHAFMRRVKSAVSDQSDATVLYTLHMLLQQLLVARTAKIVPKGARLIFTGGSALNIKWNSALRDSGHFRGVWVPPFPNDTGTALGAAACHMVQQEGRWAMDWSAYAGPQLKLGNVKSGIKMSPAQLGRYIAANPEEPIVVLHGRAEVGPRALGHRSILAAATVADNKRKLNAMKLREDFRPVAPLCLEQYAPLVFEPGTPDPHMLFEHWVRLDWEHRVPAVVHLDLSARLQTINAEQCPVVTEILTAYHAETGIPLLCNTSANYNGKGFFPDIESALRWGGTRYVWADGALYSKFNLI
jgi:carbamoyltransferase